MVRFDRFTKSSQEAAQRAAVIMQRYTHNQIDTEHVLLALMEPPQGSIMRILRFLKVDPTTFSEGLDHILRTAPSGDTMDVEPGKVPITERVVRMIDLAIEETGHLTDDLISDEHLLLGILSQPDTAAARLLEGAGLTRVRVYDAIREIRQ